MGSVLPAQTPRIDSTEINRLWGQMEVAKLAQQAGDLAFARRMYDSVIAARPGEAAVYAERGYTRYNMRDTAGARRDIERAAELGFTTAMEIWKSQLEGHIPDSAATQWMTTSPARDAAFFRMYGRAERAANQGERERAIATFDSLLAIDSTLVKGLLRRGALRAEAGDMAGALADLRRAKAFGHPDAVDWVANLEARGATSGLDRSAAVVAPVPRRSDPTYDRTVPKQTYREFSELPAYLGTIRTELTGLAAGILLFTGILVLMYQLSPALRVAELDFEGDEKQLWIGAPIQGVLLRASDLAAFVLLMATGIAVSALAMLAVVEDVALRWAGAVLIELMFFAIVYMTIGRALVDARRRKVTTYALTNRRAIVSEGAKMYTYPLSSLRTAVLDSRRDGTGSIILGSDNAATQGTLESAIATGQLKPADIGKFVRMTRHRTREFANIPDAARVYRIIQDALRAESAAAMPSSLSRT